MMILQWILSPRIKGLTPKISSSFTLEMPSIYRIGRLNHNELIREVVEDMDP
jgi:hypothetical protein